MKKSLDKSFKNQKDSQNFDVETSDRSRVQSLQNFDHVMNCMAETCTDEDDKENRVLDIIMKNNNSCVVNDKDKDRKFYCGNLGKIYSDNNEDIEKKIKDLIEEEDVPCDEMIMNENIDFLFENSSEKSSGNLSFMYTETVESVFSTLIWQSGLMKSLSQLNGVSDYKEFKRYETMDPRIGVERQDLKCACESASMIEVGNVSIIDKAKVEIKEIGDDKSMGVELSEQNIVFETESKCTMCRLENCLVF
ncbi:hypothetical protein SteCoe_16456 [Stentor coeruleus]|uniref:Uncharacterized protein n=1 Tax=Stentor coeruleus TaxID=5963 RepID=A0A1R2C156_9CILI|nr:hypothetical protein SteCoe_16456 [Stentor coeruleus]